MAGTGKSMRAMRMMEMLCEGWIEKSGNSSSKAGLNGGMANDCGRMIYFDGARSRTPRAPTPLAHSTPLRAQR